MEASASAKASTDPSVHERGAKLTADLLRFLREQKATKGETKVAIANLALMFNQRVVPIGTAVGQTQKNAPKGADSVKAGSKAKAKKSAKKTATAEIRPTSATWKQDPRWLAATHDRSAKVAELKNEDDEGRAAVLIGELREIEDLMRRIKTDLRA